jgi:hypothetical protein
MRDGTRRKDLELLVRVHFFPSLPSSHSVLLGLSKFSSGLLLNLGGLSNLVAHAEMRKGGERR